MKVKITERGFEYIEVDGHDSSVHCGPKRLLQESSTIGDYDDAFDRPGTSFLWVGEHHHLNREQVEEMIAHMQSWIDTGSLFTE